VVARDPNGRDQTMDVEWIILADAAEVVNNKLYLIGGGWSSITVKSDLPVQHPCAVAVAFSVPWNATNQQHQVDIEIVDQDGERLANVHAQVEVGRPPGIPLGQAQRVQMAISLSLPLKKLGTHAVVARIEGQEIRRAQFNVVTRPVAVPRQSRAT
jgi:hypothetical protein